MPCPAEGLAQKKHEVEVNSTVEVVEGDHGPPPVHTHIYIYMHTHMHMHDNRYNNKNNKDNKDKA